MQRLRAAQHRGKPLQRRSDNIVVGLLPRKRATGCLRVRAKSQASLVIGPEAITHHFGPDGAGRAELRDLFKEITVRIEEEAQPWREAIHRQATFDGPLD